MVFETERLLTALATAFVPMVLSLGLHEWGHALAAVALGDETPREQGRLTPNPVAHMDWLGSVVLPLVLVMSNVPVFGWARPVQFTPRRFTRRISMSTGLMLTHAAGPAMNLLIAILSALLIVGSTRFGIHVDHRYELLATNVLLMNAMLFVFNLLPVPPLDGSRVLLGLLPASWRGGYVGLQRYSSVFLALLFVVGGQLIALPSRSLSEGLLNAARTVFP